ncbi:hypothetical protein [Mucilaginibacter gotjawali]|uniref:RNase H-like HicB family nuclease n=2 Tax=Mucilaginibacter gotjawali TaxID=1550579 RepID=A0A839SKD6_9SPHI|nr:hypothetical protein [Mucilaginibacter gotjawali]MBB3057340.1 putative RNase H-like HicB family nuclease [Mucilaginibacter gotjawali]BAU52895.1 hypothetical protein MgSA37_01059 [Mucilaginibacter gotjawali]
MSKRQHVLVDVEIDEDVFYVVSCQMFKRCRAACKTIFEAM